MELHSILTQQTWRVIENSTFTPRHDTLASFAVDDTLCHSVGLNESPAVARYWVHDNTIVLGIQDSRLPELQRGIDDLRANGWRVIVRNSGGLAVVLDEGIYNLSLILNEKKHHLSIEKGFETMVALLRKLLAPYGVDFKTGEIVGSYCPGKYDLSVDGKKFAGISQRRIRGGVAVQVYLCTSGSGSERARVIERFYSLAAQTEVEHIPPIHPETMVSLAEITSQTIAHADLNAQLIQLFNEHGGVICSDLNKTEKQRFQQYYDRVTERTKKVLSPINS